jgi:hypothetical protein
VLQSFFPGRESSQRVTELKPWVRGVVTGYVLLVVPLLGLSFVLMVLHAPRAFATAFDSIGVQWDKVATANGLLAGSVGVIQLTALVLPCAGMALTTGRVSTRLGGAAWTWSAGDPLRRGSVVTVVAAAIGLVAFTWWPNGDYRPIQPGEKGTIQGAIASLRAIPSGRPSLTPERARELGGAPSERDVRAGRAKRNREAAGPQAFTRDGTAAPRGEGETAPTPTATPDGQATPTATPTPTAGAAPTATTTPEATSTPAPTTTAEPTTTATPATTP